MGGALKEVRRALLDADVNLKVANRVVEGVKEKTVGMKLVDGEARSSLADCFSSKSCLVHKI